MDNDSGFIKETLKSNFDYWLTYYDISFCMNFLKRKIDEKFKFEITSVENKSEFVLKKGIEKDLKNFLSNNKNDTYILFFSIEKRHWVVMNFIKNNGKLYIIFFDSSSYKTYDFNQIKKYLTDLNIEFEFHEIVTNIQKDGSNCGIFCLIFTMMILRVDLFDKNELLIKQLKKIVMVDYPEDFLIKTRLRLCRYILSEVNENVNNDGAISFFK